MSNTTVRVYGTFEDALNAPATGQVTFQPSVRSLYDIVTLETMSSAPKGVRFNPATGFFEIQLLATDDPDRPANTTWVYEVRIYINGMGEIVFNLSVPIADAVSGIDLGTVIPLVLPDAESGGGQAYVVSVDGRTGHVILSDLYDPLGSAVAMAIALGG